MPQKIVAANWKMNLNFQEANALISEVTNILKDEKRNNSEVIFAVPFVYIHYLSNFLKNSSFAIGAQNCSEYEKGAYTGEISAQMLASVGAKWVIVGHSERRLHYLETHRMIAEKIQRALQAGLKVIFCCGESLEIRNKNEHIVYVQNQLEGSLSELSAEQIRNLVIAYEPVWAIGTGRNATADQAQEMHALIRIYLKKKFGDEIAQNTSILYGGSVNAQNAQSLFACPDVDGGLVGGASLKAREFAEIVKTYN